MTTLLAANSDFVVKSMTHLDSFEASCFLLFVVLCVFRNINVPVRSLLSIGTFVRVYSSFELAAAVYTEFNSPSQFVSVSSLILPSLNVVKNKR